MLQKIFRVALLLSIAFEVLVYNPGPGVGQLLFWGLGLGATVLLNRAAERKPLHSAWMFVPPLLFALSVTIYDSSVVRFWSTGLGTLTLFWAVAWNLLEEREDGALAQLFPNFTFHPSRIGMEGADVWRSAVNWNPDSEKKTSSLLKGVVLTLPLMLVFGALLASADMVFAQMLEAFELQVGKVSFASPLRILLCLGLAGAWLKIWLTSPKASAPQPRSYFGSTELSLALTALNLMFVTFLVIQVRFLFGGAQLVESLGLNYADYARKGFFELSLCIALILPLVAVAYRAAEHENDQRLRLLGGTLVLQAGGLAISAFRRMSLYIDAYGLSTERFYAAAGILVALCVLAWAAYACLKPQTVSWVMSRQTVTVFFLLAGLSLVNVENLVVQYNVRRHTMEGKELDLSYFAQFSSDALPALRENASLLQKPQQALAQDVVHSIAQKTATTTVFDWNLSRTRAGEP